MLKNVAKGKKVTTTADFVKVFSTLTLDQKMAVCKNMNTVLESGVNPSGKKLTEQERPALEQLSRWAGVNVLIGNELCPPESLHQY